MNASHIDYIGIKSVIEFVMNSLSDSSDLKIQNNVNTVDISFSKLNSDALIEIVNTIRENRNLKIISLPNNRPKLSTGIIILAGGIRKCSTQSIHAKGSICTVLNGGGSVYSPFDENEVKQYIVFSNHYEFLSQ